MQRKFLVAAGTLLLIAAAAAVLFRSPRQSFPNPPVASEQSNPSAPSIGQTKPAPPSAPSAAEPPLPASKRTAAQSVRTMQLGSVPSLHEPLAPAIPALEERAKNGDAEAAVRLWYGLEQCASLTNGSAEADLKSIKNGYDNDRNIRRPDYTTLIRDLLANCADVTGPQMDKRFEWLKAAAEQGNPQAQYLYALAGPDAVGGTTEALRDPQKWAEYRETSIAYMDALAKQCSGEAIADLASSYTFGSAYRSRDAVKGYMYRVISVRFPDFPEKLAKGYLAQFSAKMSEDEINQATRLADQFYSRYCN